MTLPNPTRSDAFARYLIILLRQVFIDFIEFVAIVLIHLRCRLLFQHGLILLLILTRRNHVVELAQLILWKLIVLRSIRSSSEMITSACNFCFKTRFFFAAQLIEEAISLIDMLISLVVRFGLLTGDDAISDA